MDAHDGELRVIEALRHENFEYPPEAGMSLVRTRSELRREQRAHRLEYVKARAQAAQWLADYRRRHEDWRRLSGRGDREHLSELLRGRML